jgi:putative endonuclease
MSPDNTTPDAAANEAAPAGAAAPALPSAAAGRPAASGEAARNALVRRAEQHLQSAGLRILDRNWRCADGQIDIVAADQRVLVVCDVRTRSGSGRRTPPEAMSRAKRRRLRRLAIRWLVAHGLLFDEVRVDVVSLLRDPSGAFTVEHVAGVC